MIKTGIHKNSTFTLIIIGLIIITSIFFYMMIFLYPSYKSLSIIRQSVLEKTSERDRLNLLFPVYARSRILNQTEFDQGLPLPERKQIHRSELAELSRQISKIANRNNLLLSNSDFDINSLNDPSDFVSITVELKGKLSDFRFFLIDIIAIKFFDSIRTLRISSDKEQTKHFSLQMDIRTKKR